MQGRTFILASLAHDSGGKSPEASAKHMVDPFHGEESEGTGDWPLLVGWRLTAKTSLPMSSNCDICRRRLVSRTFKPIPDHEMADFIHLGDLREGRLTCERSLDTTSAATGAFGDDPKSK